MCGIVGYIGYRQAYPLIISGLRRLEYRGYDSAGVALLTDGVQVFKKKGKVAELEAFVADSPTTATVGIGHTRWATHGAPNDANAHPHTSQNGLFTLIHNGIIENYAVIKKELAEQGYTFRSSTDTEVLVQFIEYLYTTQKLSAEAAVRRALQHVVGAYGIVVMCQNEPDRLILARKSSPLVIGIGEGEYIVASDATPIIEYTKDVIYLDDDQIAVVTRDQHIVKTIGNVLQSPTVTRVEMDVEAIEKGGFDHFMLKEIFEQPKSIAETMRGRIAPDHRSIYLGGLVDVREKLRSARRILITACGTSWHAGLVGEYLIEEFARVPVEVEYASEFRYRNPIIYKDDILIAISQSGETADTLAAVEMAKRQGALVLGIVNVVGSSIARATHAGMYIHAGPEIGVASTKAFTSQVTALALLAGHMAELRGLASNNVQDLIHELVQMPGKIQRILDQNDAIRDIALRIAHAQSALFLGRGYNFPVALEGALKLKEISYIHAEGYPAAEMKHGPIALIDESLPVVFIATRDELYEKTVSNLEEVLARKGQIIAIATEGDHHIREKAQITIEVPRTSAPLAPLLNAIPLQLLSYHAAVALGRNVDQPRNLAKSVTVE